MGGDAEGSTSCIRKGEEGGMEENEGERVRTGKGIGGRERKGMAVCVGRVGGGREGQGGRRRGILPISYSLFLFFFPPFFPFSPSFSPFYSRYHSSTPIPLFLSPLFLSPFILPSRCSPFSRPPSPCFSLTCWRNNLIGTSSPSAT